MTRRKPVQRRSRDRVEQILLAAADLLAKSGGTDELTTTSVSKRSGVPVATIYRYFANRMAIIAALIDRETEEIDLAIVKRFDELETMSLDILLETIMMAHLRHFQSRRRAIVLWFGARQSKTVLDRVDRRYAYLGGWIRAGAHSSGLLRSETPDFGPEGIVWLSDRMFEFIFRKERTLVQQTAILGEFLDMISTQIRKYATETTEISMAEFLAHFGAYAPVSGAPAGR